MREGKRAMSIYASLSTRQSSRSIQVHSVWLFLVLLFLGSSSVRAQTSNGTVQEFRTLYPSEWNVPYPAGLAYSIELDRLYLLDRGSREPLQRTGSTLVILTPYEDMVATVHLTFTVDDAMNVTYDDATDVVLLLNNKRAEIARVAFGKDEFLDPNVAEFSVDELGLKNAEGMAVDLANRRLFVLDSGTSQVVSAELDNDFQLISKVDLSHLGASNLRGIAVHPLSYNLFVVSPHEELLYELIQSGQLVNTYDLADLDLVDPRGLVFAPSADLTDAPSTIHLYMTDSNLPDEGQTNSGKIFRVAQLRGSSLLRSDIGSARAQTEQVFGRILEVVLLPEGSNTATRSYCKLGDEE
jgi:hypothetical protein